MAAPSNLAWAPIWANPRRIEETMTDTSEPGVRRRSAGVLLHPTSLPSRFGIGDLGPEAARYVRWLADAGATWWQVLPLHPVGPGNSPYSATSTFAGNEWLISPELLVADGLLVPEEIETPPDFPGDRVDFGTALPWKRALLRTAFERFDEACPAPLARDLEVFREEHRVWLPDFALYRALKRAHDEAPWWSWRSPLARRHPDALEAWEDENRAEVERVVFEQWLFFRQWTALRKVAGEAEVEILGDMPIFVSRDSADVWTHPDLFLLDGNLRPTVVAGVPPDYFSETGQRWGNPLYDWKALEESGYAWWITRFRHALTLADAVRLDHFRGFQACWEVPAKDRTAANGRWRPGPGAKLFRAVKTALGDLPLVAEDLGEITKDVVALRRSLGLPGMAILQFGFAPEPRSTFIPYAHERDLVVYTGTHDNNTALGWYREDATEPEKDLVRRYVGCDGRDIHWDLIRLALASVAETAIVPHQDLAGLGSEHRMNTPGKARGNWTFRLPEDAMSDLVRDRLKELIDVYDRGPRVAEEPHRPNPSAGERT